jgi:hypothetical protein
MLPLLPAILRNISTKFSNHYLRGSGIVTYKRHHVVKKRQLQSWGMAPNTKTHHVVVLRLCLCNYTKLLLYLDSNSSICMSHVSLLPPALMLLSTLRSGVNNFCLRAPSIAVSFAVVPKKRLSAG